MTEQQDADEPVGEPSGTAEPEPEPSGGTASDFDTSDSRAKPPAVESVADRVAHIRELMVSGAYVTGKTPYELSARWGVTVSTIWNYSAEASRQVRAGMGDADQIRTRVLGWLERAAQMASSEGGARGAQALTGAAKELAAIAGVAAPQQVTVTGLAELLALGFKPDACSGNDSEDA